MKHARMADMAAGAPQFTLQDVTSGRMVSLADFAPSPAIVVAFICNHCPFVGHIIGPFSDLMRSYRERGASTIAICSNDVERYPDDSPDRMREFAAQHGFAFPYLHDADQSVALAYGAICTPELFLFNARRDLVYRGRFDASRPHTERRQGNNLPVTGEDLRAALDAVLTGEMPVQADLPAIGCAIKWKPENEPMWEA